MPRSSAHRDWQPHASIVKQDVKPTLIILDCFGHFDDCFIIGDVNDELAHFDGSVDLLDTLLDLVYL